MSEIIDSKARHLITQMPIGGIYTNKDGKTVKFNARESDNRLDFTKMLNTIATSNGGGTGSSGGTTAPDDGTNTSGGVNIVPGSIRDGSVGERYLLWEGQTKTTGTSTLTFLDDVGSKINRIGDGLQFRVHLAKTAVSKGVKAESSKLSLLYDSKNEVKSSFYVTTSPIPFSIPVSNFAVGKKVTVTVDGIGEGFQNVKNHLAPTITFTFNSDKTMSVDVTEGYDLDGAVEGNTGAFYTIVLDLVTSYSTQSAVTQLPAGMSLMSGDADGEIPLQFVNDDFSNISGLQVTFNPKLILDSIDPEGQDNILNHYYVKFDDLGLPFNQVLKIGKDDLYSGFHLDFDVANLPKLKVYSVSDNTVLTYPLDYSPTSVRANSEIKLVNGKLLVDVHLDQKTTFNGDIRNKTYTLKVSSVSTY